MPRGRHAPLPQPYRASPVGEGGRAAHYSPLPPMCVVSTRHPLGEGGNSEQHRSPTHRTCPLWLATGIGCSESGSAARAACCSPPLRGPAPRRAGSAACSDPFRLSRNKATEPFPSCGHEKHSIRLSRNKAASRRACSAQSIDKTATPRDNTEPPAKPGRRRGDNPPERREANFAHQRPPRTLPAHLASG